MEYKQILMLSNSLYLQSKEVALGLHEISKVVLPILIAAVIVFELYQRLFSRSGGLSLKQDYLIMQQLKSDHPGYDIKLLTSDLVGLGEKFLIVYGNKSYVRSLHGNGDIGKILESKDYNRPFLKIYYIEDDTLFEYFMGRLQAYAPSRLRKHLVKVYEFSPVIKALATNKKDSVRQYIEEFSGPSVFLIDSVVIGDLDSDGKEEIVANWIAYGGGTEGQRFSTILRLKGQAFQMGTGIPDVLDLPKAKLLWSFLKASGMEEGRKKFSSQIEEKTLQDFTNSPLQLTAEEIEMLSTGAMSSTQFGELMQERFMEKWQQDPYLNLYDPKSEETIVTPAFSSDDFIKWYKVDDEWVLAVAFYIDDNNCHWCPHDWRLMAFRYVDGRWISDRTINGDRFDGMWLSKDQLFDLNEVFGTYPDQGLMGFAWSFMNSSWTQESHDGAHDPWGREMRVRSPVEIRLRNIFANYSSESRN